MILSYATILDILFPKFCIHCEREGSYLCEDCLSLINILEEQYCPFCQIPKITRNGKTCNNCAKLKNLDSLFCAVSYENLLIKKTIKLFKYEPFIKELSKHLTGLIIAHLQILKEKPQADFVIPIPCHKHKLKKRGFNQATEIALKLSKFLEIPLLDDVLIKTKQTPPQMRLTRQEREENVKGVFLCKKPEIMVDKKILLIDDILTTGATIEECAKILKNAGAKEVCAIVVARGIINN